MPQQEARLSELLSKGEVVPTRLSPTVISINKCKVYWSLQMFTDVIWGPADDVANHPTEPEALGTGDREVEAPLPESTFGIAVNAAQPPGVSNIAMNGGAQPKTRVPEPGPYFECAGHPP